MSFSPIPANDTVTSNSGKFSDSLSLNATEININKKIRSFHFSESDLLMYKKINKIEVKQKCFSYKSIFLEKKSNNTNNLLYRKPKNIKSNKLFKTDIFDFDSCRNTNELISCTLPINYNEGIFCFFD